MLFKHAEVLHLFRSVEQRAASPHHWRGMETVGGAHFKTVNAMLRKCEFSARYAKLFRPKSAPGLGIGGILAR